jgi:tetratricopeptide (TPR) repeat protein
MDLAELLGKSLALGEEGRWEEVADLLREHLPDHGDEPAVHCWLGVAETELGLEGIGYERFRTALGLQPEDPLILAVAGSGIAAFDDPDAEYALRAAAMLGPGVAEARWRYGAYLSREGMIQDALRELEAARELAPDDPVVLMELGVARALGEDWDAAADAFGQAVRLGPEDGWPRMLLGLLELERGALEEAAAELEAGARLLPEDVEAQFLASLACGAVGREGLAFELLERGRIYGEAADLLLASEVEDRLDEGAERAADFLQRELAPGALRSRLMTRP